MVAMRAVEALSSGMGVLPIICLNLRLNDVNIKLEFDTTKSCQFSIPPNTRNCMSRKENPQKPTQLSSRSHPRHLVGKRTAQKTPS